MASIDVGELKAWEKLADYRNHLVRHVLAACAADEKRRLRKAYLTGVLEWEIPEVVE